jgi:hypothetical protein
MTAIAVVLTGPPGGGKSSVLDKLATLLGRELPAGLFANAATRSRPSLSHAARRCRQQPMPVAKLPVFATTPVRRRGLVPDTRKRNAIRTGTRSCRRNGCQASAAWCKRGCREWCGAESMCARRPEMGRSQCGPRP